MTKPVKYRYIQDARSDYPYAAVLIKNTDQYTIPASWTFARKLDSGEVEVLYDGHGTCERFPGSAIELRTPPEQQLPHDENSANAWDAFLGESNPETEDQ